MIPVTIKNLVFSYPQGRNNILDNVNMKISGGGISAITGTSGSGKTTLCYCICGIIPHIYSGKISGEVLLFGKPIKDMDLAKIATKIGIVFQEPDTQLFSPTVEDEVAFGPENLCLSRDEIGKRIKSSLNIVGMENKRYEHTSHLSGGEKQLIAIASVLALDPRILILDEVMSGIDKAGRMRIKQAILNLKDSGRSIMLVTHDMDDLDIADSMFELKDGKLLSLAYK